MNMKERIKSLCKEKGITANKLEKDLGFGGGYISKLDKSTPNTANIQKIADYFEVSLEYLMTGLEPLALDSWASDETADFIIEVTKMAKNQEFVDRMTKYMSLMNEDKKSIDDMIDFMYNKQQKKGDH